MDKSARVMAALRKKAVDRIPCSCWMHFGPDEKHGPGAVEAHAGFFKKYDWDFLKVMNDLPYDLPTGLEKITRPADLDRLKTLRMNSGSFRLHLDTLALLRKSLGKKVLMATTIFNPWAVAMKFSDGQIAEMAAKSPKKVKKALEIIGSNLARFAQACLENGADGIFLALEGARRGQLSSAAYCEIARPFDLMVLEAVKEAPLNILHLHGPHVYFDLCADYPVSVFNWDVFQGNISLSEGKAKTGKCVAGGINPQGAIAAGDTVEVVVEIRNAVDETDGLGLIVAPGCAVPPNVRPQDLKVIRAALER